MKQYKSVRTFFLALVLLGVSLTHRSGLKGEEMEITKAIIPAAGLGTRFLPYVKAVPKEMLPLLDKPAIQYIVEEGIASGITNFSIITSDQSGRSKTTLTQAPTLNYFLGKKTNSI